MSVSVVGFDIGNSTSFVAVAKGGGIETIDNEYSDRCTPTYVSFGEKNRFMGASAKQQAITNIKNTIYNFPRLLGKSFDDPAVQRELPFLPFKVIKNSKDGKIAIECDYAKEKMHFSPEQVMAIQLTKLKEITENHLKAPCVDVVINVPTYFTDSERRAVLDSASIAGLNCVRLVNDTTACGIAYGLYNKDFPEVDKPPRVVAFVMFGESNLQVSLVAFNNGRMKVLSNSCDSNLGGRDFDRKIFDHMCADIKTRFKLDVKKNDKATVRLLQECEKLKKLMSANSTKIPLNIECFMEDKDINCHLQRSEFQALISDELARIESTLMQSLKSANLKPTDVTFVELVGGSTRVPIVKQIVAKVFGQEGRTTLNSDEAVARGCALLAAICSPAFKVREFAIIDCCPYSIKLICETCDTNQEPHTVEIFPCLHPVPSNRQVDLKRRSDFRVHALYSDPSKLSIANPKIGSYFIRGVVSPVDNEDAKVLLKVRMNRHGIFNIGHAQMAQPYQKEVEVDMTPEEAAAATKMEVDAPKSEESTDTSKTKESEEAQKPAAVPKKLVTKTFNKFIDLTIESTDVQQLSEVELNRFRELENEMIGQDRLERERSNAKNSLEEYIYEMRDKLSGVLEPFIFEADREKFSSELTKIEDWLYDEGEDLPKQPYIDRLQSLKSIGDVYVFRFVESEQRPMAMDRLARALVHVEKAVISYMNGEETFNHLTQEEMSQVQQALDSKRTWYEQIHSKIQGFDLHNEPPVTAMEILRQADELENVTSPFLMKKKPTVTPPPPPNGATNGTSEPVPEAANGNNNEAPNETKGTKNKSNGEAECMDLD